MSRHAISSILDFIKNPWNPSDPKVSTLDSNSQNMRYQSHLRENPRPKKKYRFWENHPQKAVNLVESRDLRNPVFGQRDPPPCQKTHIFGYFDPFWGGVADFETLFLGRQWADRAEHFFLNSPKCFAWGVFSFFRFSAWSPRYPGFGAVKVQNSASVPKNLDFCPHLNVPGDIARLKNIL